MKKIFTTLLALILIVSAFVSCGKAAENKKNNGTTVATVRIGALKGPTSMGMVKMLDDSENGKTSTKYEYTLAAAADEITPKFLKGELDIVAVPANLASTLYNNSDGKSQALCVNTLGVLYIVEKETDTVNCVSDLKGKTVYATGKGTVPELSLKYLLSENGIDAEKDIEIIWKNEPSEIIAQMSTQESAVAMLPQPFVTVAQSKIQNLRIAVDLTKEWSEINENRTMITSVIVTRKDFAENNLEVLENFISEYNDSCKYVNDNPKDAGVLIEKYGIIKADVAEKAIPFCNLVCITGNEMKTSLHSYLSVLYNMNPKSVGGELPKDDFYLIYE